MWIQIWLDPDSLGSVDLDSESGSWGIKWREEQSLTKKQQQFRKKLYFSSLNYRHSPDEGYSLRFRFRLNNKKFFFTLKICFEIYLGIILTWILTGSGFIEFCGSGSEFNQSGSTSLFLGQKSFLHWFISMISGNLTGSAFFLKRIQGSVCQKNNPRIRLDPQKTLRIHNSTMRKKQCTYKLHLTKKNKGKGLPNPIYK